MERVALIDGDILVYSCGFASDAAAKASGLAFEPWGFCKKGVDATIHSILDNTGASEYIVFLTSHGGGYRDDLFHDYKATRPAAKPHWYEQIRSYLLAEKRGVISTAGREADDELGISSCSIQAAGLLEPVICSKDKDLDMIPGLHYNFSKTKKGVGVYEVTELEGLRFFYKQMLSGDSTDNIPGMFRIFNEKATSKWKAPLDSMEAEDEMYAYVREVYLTLGREKGITYQGHDLSTEEGCDRLLFLLGQLLWIQNGTGLWTPPIGIVKERIDGKEAYEEGVEDEDAAIPALP